MGLSNSALSIGLSALRTYESTLHVIGNNIGNVGNADYTRQTAGLAAVHGSPLPEGFQPGAGVALDSVRRNIDEALEGRLRSAIGDGEASSTRSQMLGRVESFFDESTGMGIAGRMNEFFNSFSDVQNDPSDLGLRQITIAHGAALAGSLNTLRTNLTNLGNDIDSQIVTTAAEADRIADEIANLNTRIAAAEGGFTSAAHSLRDQRDALLRELSTIFDVTVRHQPDGSANVYIGSEPLIQGGVSRGLTTTTTVDGEFSRTRVLFDDGGSPVNARGGRLAGLIQARDIDAFGRLSEIDELAGAIIEEVNRVHADGQGMRLFESTIGSYSVSDPSAALNSTAAGLAFPPVDGSFFITIEDAASGAVASYQINVDLDGVGSDTSLESLVADINDTVPDLTAAIAPGNRLQLQAADGVRFSFGYDGAINRPDTSGVLAALGVNAFFDGQTAADIRVNAALEAAPELLAAAEVNLSGDGNNAGRLAEVGITASQRMNGMTLLEGHNRIANAVAVAGSRALEDLESNESVLVALKSQKESISGVSLDEEAVELVKFERAFQGAARYVSVVDRLLTEMMNLVR